MQTTTCNQTKERKWDHPSHVACLPANVEGNVFVLDHVSGENVRDDAHKQR